MLLKPKSNTTVTILAALAAFGTYTCMYAFRKAFAAGTFEQQSLGGIDYKVWLIIAQIMGYTLSKFIGIKLISTIKASQRAWCLILLIAVAWLALLLFAIIPAPYNIFCLFLNGLPLGMIWGLVFSFLEGRKSTEFMAAVMSISLIFASGFVKTVARLLMSSAHIDEYWMPFATGAVFCIPLALCVYLLNRIPPPNNEDIEARNLRLPMTAHDRSRFIKKFGVGIFITIIIYTMLTVIRDVRDNFEVEIWNSLGIYSKTIYTQTDTIISIIVLVMMSLLILIKNNIKAFMVIHAMIIAGFLLIGIASALYHYQLISSLSWMTTVGLGLFMAYVPYNAIFFERMLASYKIKGNVGFVMYMADAAGYLGSISLLFFKQLNHVNLNWADFFKQGVITVACLGGAAACLSLLYFKRKANKKTSKTNNPINELLINA